MGDDEKSWAEEERQMQALREEIGTAGRYTLVLHHEREEEEDQRWGVRIVRDDGYWIRVASFHYVVARDLAKQILGYLQEAEGYADLVEGWFRRAEEPDEDLTVDQVLDDDGDE